MKHQPFDALAQGRTDYTVRVIPILESAAEMYMTVCASEEAVYITKTQAMEFFDLMEKPE